MGGVERNAGDIAHDAEVAAAREVFLRDLAMAAMDGKLVLYTPEPRKSAVAWLKRLGYPVLE